MNTRFGNVADKGDIYSHVCVIFNAGSRILSEAIRSLLDVSWLFL